MLQKGGEVGLGHHTVQPLTSAVKSDQCSILKARISRTEAGNQGSALRARSAANRLAKSSLSVV